MLVATRIAATRNKAKFTRTCLEFVSHIVSSVTADGVYRSRLEEFSDFIPPPPSSAFMGGIFGIFGTTRIIIEEWHYLSRQDKTRRPSFCEVELYNARGSILVDPYTQPTVVSRTTSRKHDTQLQHKGHACDPPVTVSQLQRY